MAKHHNQPPRPVTPLPTPAPAQTPKSDAPVILSCALGRTADGRHAAALLKTQGLAVLSCALVAQPTRDVIQAEEAWQSAAYTSLYLGQHLPVVRGLPLVEGVALALVRTERLRTQAVVLEVEAGKVLPLREANPKALDFEERRGSTIYEGARLDAWHELDNYAAHHLLRASLSERRMKASGGKS